MTRKTRAAYTELLEFVRDLVLPSLEDITVHIVTDFERGLQAALKSVFPEAFVHGCWFHFSQVHILCISALSN